MRFTTRVFAMQLLAATAVIAVCVSAFALLGIGQLRDEAESTALAVARTVASDPQVRADVAGFAGRSDLDAATLADGALQEYAAGIVDRTQTLFVVVANDLGLRLAHPDPDLLGRRVSTDFASVIAGEEVIAWERGTLGESVRAKVPVFAPDGGRIVGEVSVGFAPARVFADAPLLVGLFVLIAVVALAVAALVSVVIRRRLERLTRGVQPEELGGLLQSRAAVLEGVHDGVLAVSDDGVVRAANAPALRVVGDDDAVGRHIDELDLPPRLRTALDRALGGDSLVTGELVLSEQVVYVEVRRVGHEGRSLGVVAVLRDRTDVVALAERLDAVRAATNAMRAQRHEFANRMHAVRGMVAAGRTAEAQELLSEFAARGALPEEAGVPVAEPFLRSFLASKRMEARERGVELRVGEDTLLLGVVAEPEDVAAVLGNLVDNAVTAAAAGEEPRWVEVSLLDDRDELALTVTDSGIGVDHPESVFDRARAAEEDETGRVHGRGIGLPLARRFTRRRGGELWLAEARGGGHGAVFAARLPGVMRAAGDDELDGAITSEEGTA
ncbi:sensor histidine kinase [Microbacterium oryzae]|uniref:histidine kinase n=1 Tax=Microbacterium oryzae TaxID=743009 RepID=A0A6I6EC89_9MICO|nr:sensor histidine kinase [Microbacterium oryzae]QGU28608.1 sensor histidine kinase [Microbacterium oryzae]